MEIKIINQESTDEEVYSNLKENYKKYPTYFMNPKEWKRLRLIELKKMRRVWSK